ncbi:MAG: hypothetical protein IPN34_10540 [Planctomycetes bacterium]|nr:hypothetical protein [Planctomycetota bacterium]
MSSPCRQSLRLLAPAFVAVLCAPMLHAQDASSPSIAAPRPQEPKVTTTIGMEGSYFLLHRGGRLFAKPLPRSGEVENVPPFLVWIVERVPDGEAERYELRFVGNEAGDYDLGAYLEDAEGQRAQGLEPMPVRVTALLPERHDGSLSSSEPVSLPVLGGYQTLLWILGVAWGVPVLWWLVRALIRRRPRRAAEGTAEPTLADQLRPLVERAIAHQLDAAGQAQLERMLLAHWRDRLSLRGLPHLEALRRMKVDADAGALLSGLERWLHQPPGASEAPRVEELLAPYRAVRAVDERELVPASAPTRSAAEAR